jgi:hypothetical protein
MAANADLHARKVRIMLGECMHLFIDFHLQAE